MNARAILGLVGVAIGALALDEAAAVEPEQTRPVRLAQVLESVDRHFPELAAARQRIVQAEGKLLSARGGFDTRFDGGFEAETSGFYQNEIVNVGVTQPISASGLDFSAGYKRGAGDFAEYDKGLATNGNGEWRVGMALPLLRDRGIDDRRVNLRSAEAGLQRVDADVAARVLEIRLAAAIAYWRWVAAGEKFRVADRLVRLALDRQETMKAGVEEGLLPALELTDNERLIAERRAIRIQNERALEQASIGLSLYFRDADGDPLQPRASQLPEGFPSPPAENDVSIDDALQTALARRPELRELEQTRRQAQLELRRARNDRLPRLDLRVDASQDDGTAFSSPDDKADFELSVGLALSLPIQQRRARGAIVQRSADLGRIDQQTRLQRDRISVEVRDAISAQTQAWRRIEQARRSVELARELEAAERFQLEEGDSDLLRLNIRERQTAQASAFLIDVLQEYYEAWTRYRVVLGEAADGSRLVPDWPEA